jgi:hypothetical protein
LLGSGIPVILGLFCALVSFFCLYSRSLLPYNRSLLTLWAHRVVITVSPVLFFLCVIFFCVCAFVCVCVHTELSLQFRLCATGERALLKICGVKLASSSRPRRCANGMYLSISIFIRISVYFSYIHIYIYIYTYTYTGHLFPYIYIYIYMYTYTGHPRDSCTSRPTKS